MLLHRQGVFGILRPDWFAHENVVRFPGEIIQKPFAKAGYEMQETHISPQRFGKPMNRQHCFEILFVLTSDVDDTTCGKNKLYSL